MSYTSCRDQEIVCLKYHVEISRFQDESKNACPGGFFAGGFCLPELSQGNLVLVYIGDFVTWLFGPGKYNPGGYSPVTFIGLLFASF